MGLDPNIDRLKMSHVVSSYNTSDYAGVIDTLSYNENVNFIV